LRVPESEYQFWTFRQFGNAVKAFYEMQEASERQNWERTRWSTWVLLNVQLDKKNRIEQTKLLPFDWDAETQQASKKAAKKGLDEKARARFARWDEEVKKLSKPN
jgi:hypothetical protein